MNRTERYHKAKETFNRFRPKWLRSPAITLTRKLLDILFLNYHLKEERNCLALSFKEGILKGQKILFPSPNDFICSVPIELPGYFADGKSIKPGNAVFDGGAWPGDFTVIASRLVGPTGRVYAFEPNPEGAEYLRRMLKVNNCTNVYVFEEALSNNNQSSRFFTDGMSSKLDTSGQIEVSNITIDDFVQKTEQPDLIKLDVEGAEMDIVSAASNTIKSKHPAWAIASYHVVNGQQTRFSLEYTLAKVYSRVRTGYPLHQTTFAV